MCEETQGQRSDADLARELRDGGNAAFDALFDRYRPLLLAYVRGMLHDRALAEDVVQDTFLGLVRQRRRIDPRRGVKSWLFRVARNRAIDVLRKRRPEIVAEDVAERPDRSGEQSVERPSAGIEREELRSDVRRLLELLPQRERDVLMLHYLGDMPFREVADVVKRPLGTVLWQSRRAIERLRKHLDSQEGRRAGARGVNED